MNFLVPIYSLVTVVWVIKVLTFTLLILTLYATVNIFQSLWFKFWSSRNMSDQEKKEFYVAKKYDIKWTSSMAVMSLLGFVLFQLIGLKDLSWWNLFCAVIFGILFWGNYRILHVEEKKIIIKKNFDI